MFSLVLKELCSFPTRFSSPILTHSNPLSLLHLAPIWVAWQVPKLSLRINPFDFWTYQGVIIVTDLPPEFVDLRERLLRLAEKFAALPESVRESYTDAKSRWRCVMDSVAIWSTSERNSYVPTAALDGRMEKCVLPSMMAQSHWLLHEGDHEWEARWYLTIT